MPVQTNLKAGRGKSGRELINGRLTRPNCQKDLDLCAMMAGHGHIPADYLAKCDACLTRFPDLGPAAN